MCVSTLDCSYVVTVNPKDDIYICDDLLAYADSHLGNIFRDSLSEIAENVKLIRLSEESVLLGEECRNCEFLPFCKGGCTLFRAASRDDFKERHYFCAAQQTVISHIHAISNP